MQPFSAFRITFWKKDGMSNKKLAGIIVGCIAVVIAVVTVAILGPKPVTNYSTLLRYLRESGASIEEKGEIHDFFDIEGKRVAVNGSTIEVYEYVNAEALEAEASRVSPDGFSITKELGDERWTVKGVGWIAPPHFYKAGRIIVFYCGDNASIIGLLENALGTQFAGM
jgi:hypothetical protein